MTHESNDQGLFWSEQKHKVYFDELGTHIDLPANTVLQYLSSFGIEGIYAIHKFVGDVDPELKEGDQVRLLTTELNTFTPYTPKIEGSHPHVNEE